MKYLIYILVFFFVIGIATPYGEIYLKAKDIKSNGKKTCCEKRSCCEGNSSCNTKTNNPQKPFCPLCPSLYSFNPYLPNGDEDFFILQISSLIPVPLEIIRDQGYVASIFHPPTSNS